MVIFTNTLKITFYKCFIYKKFIFCIFNKNEISYCLNLFILFQSKPTTELLQGEILQTNKLYLKIYYKTNKPKHRGEH